LIARGRRCPLSINSCPDVPLFHQSHHSYSPVMEETPAVGVKRL
jgi:hypothetical protein